MNVQGKHYRTIWLSEDEKSVCIIDQRLLPHHFVVEELHTTNDVITAIKDMHVRGAGLIGAAAGYGMYLAAIEAAEKNNFDKHLQQLGLLLATARPTAV
ncbi:MAG: hypothetical protein ABI405_14485, partial [Parafilimonas sp.]